RFLTWRSPATAGLRVPRTRDACLRARGCRRCRPDAPPAALACAACDHRPRLGPSRLGGRPSALGGLAEGSRSPSAEARPPGRRLHPPPGGRALQLGRHVTPDGLRLLWPRVCGLLLDRVEAPALELGPAARGPPGPLRAAAAGRPALHRGRRPRPARGFEADRDLGPANGRARALRGPDAA